MGFQNVSNTELRQQFEKLEAELQRRKREAVQQFIAQTLASIREIDPEFSIFDLEYMVQKAAEKGGSDRHDESTQH
ncbi:hypothetical protein ACQ4M4_25860 [Leptolyngbya sp. AN02str]|uniref:hypothetical protein n=1 Tax=Leptolyngbya sp. AN02str TaxID=3423363 RepID=UPI003D318C02